MMTKKPKEKDKKKEKKGFLSVLQTGEGKERDAQREKKIKEKMRRKQTNKKKI